MDILKQIKSCLNQAELYRSQGLLNEAREQCVQAGKLAKKHAAALGNPRILPGIIKKIKALDTSIARIEASPDLMEVPRNVQDIIKEKFAYASEEARRELEGALALVKFGQYNRALEELKGLLCQESLKMDAAKNMIRCHITLDAIDGAVAQYREWHESPLFRPDELSRLRAFLQSILDKKNVIADLPERPAPAEAAVGAAAGDAIRAATGTGGGAAAGAAPEDAAAASDAVPDAEILTPEAVEGEPMDEEMDDEEIIDISSVEITLEEGPKKGETVEYDVSFQSGRVINLLISSNDKELIETLRAGLTLRKVNFYSPIAMFNGEGVVFSKSRIESGPKEGDFSLDIEIKRIR